MKRKKQVYLKWFPRLYSYICKDIIVIGRLFSGRRALYCGGVKIGYLYAPHNNWEINWDKYKRVYDQQQPIL